VWLFYIKDKKSEANCVQNACFCGATLWAFLKTDKMSNTNRKSHLFTEKDYELLVVDDPRPIYYQYKNPANEKQLPNTRTCPICHRFKNGVGHKQACPGPCPGIEDCPTEYLKGMHDLIKLNF
jgi:hypothetical protein